MTFIRQIFIFCVEFGLFLPLLSWLLFSYWGFKQHWFTLGTITTVGIYFFQMFFPMASLLYWLEQAQSAYSSFSRVVGVGLIPQPVFSLPIPTPQGQSLMVRNLSFRYPETKKAALEDINLSVQTGERLAIVGPSGAGKTTLAKLLCGFDFPTTGSVTFGGVNLKDIPGDQLRQYISLVTQEHHIFIGTILDNVQMARSTASPEEVLAALETVGAVKWVQEIGLETLVGDGRHELSTGQAQQIALARVALANPQIVILDEATSLLDPHSGYFAETGLAQILTSRTIITIAHRLYSAQLADRIIVMEQGRITEVGTHTELLRNQHTYANLWYAWNSQ